MHAVSENLVQLVIVDLIMLAGHRVDYSGSAAIEEKPNNRAKNS